MSDFRYLDYEGLVTYTEHVKEYADGKIVYVSDESEIDNPPKEGTLYVIGSEILMDEEFILGTQTAITSNWTGKSIDTRLHNGKRIAYYLPYSSSEGAAISLTLELSDEDNTSQQKRIYVNGNPYNQVIPGGSVIRLMYYENIFANGARISGWISDGNIIQNNVTYTGTPVDEQVATFEGTTGTIKSSGYTIASSVPANAKFTDTVYTHPTTDGNKHIPAGGEANQYLKYGGEAGTAVWANPEYQFYDYGNLYKGGTSGPLLPTSLQLSGDVKFVNGGRLVIEFYNNYGQELELTGLGLSSIRFPDGTNLPLTYSLNSTSGYAGTHIGVHYLDIIMLIVEDGNVKYGYLTGYSAPRADYAILAASATTASSATTANYANYSNVVYATCNTASGTSAKVANIIGNTNFQLVAGSIAYISFTYTNTSAIISLNVGNTSSKYVKYAGDVCNNQNSYFPSWTAGDIVPFVYDGTYWQLIVAPTIAKKTNQNI